MATMTSPLVPLAIFWLSLSYTCSGALGYIPSKHPAAQRVNVADIANTILEPQSLPLDQSSPNRIRLDPVFISNPLEKFKSSQDISAPSTQPLLEVQATKAEDTINEKATAPSRDEHRRALFVSGSAALAGFTDVLCLARFNCFVNMMTGNLLKMTTALANARGADALAHALFVLSYASGVLVFSQLKGRLQSEETSVIEPLRVVAPIVAVLFMGADVVARNLGGNAKALQVPLLALGFGVVNSAAAHATQGAIYFALTGHLTRMTGALNDFVTTGSWKLDAATKKSMTIFSSFLGGAFVAAALLRQGALFGSRSLNGILPVCSTLGVLYAALFGWYAPITPVVEKAMQHVSRRIQPAFARIRSFSPESAFGNKPVLVELFPSQDLLHASNGTVSAYSAF